MVDLIELRNIVVTYPPVVYSEQDLFGTADGKRYTILRRAHCLNIFPWIKELGNKGHRRETLRDSFFIDQVVEAVNEFYSPPNGSYSDQEIQFLQNYWSMNYTALKKKPISSIYYFMQQLQIFRNLQTTSIFSSSTTVYNTLNPSITENSDMNEDVEFMEVFRPDDLDPNDVESLNFDSFSCATQDQIRAFEEKFLSSSTPVYNNHNPSTTEDSDMNEEDLITTIDAILKVDPLFCDISDHATQDQIRDLKEKISS